MSVPHRTRRWYVLASLCAVGLVIFGFLTNDWTFAVSIILIAAMYWWLRNAEAHTHRITIEEKGFKWNDAFTPWDDCRDFWLLQFPGYTELHIGKKGLSRETVIQTGDVSPDLIRETLTPILPERAKQHEHPIDYAIRLLKL